MSLYDEMKTMTGCFIVTGDLSSVDTMSELDNQ